MLAGPSGSGKTSFLIDLLRRQEEFCTLPRFRQIVWCIGTRKAPDEIEQLRAEGHNVIVKQGLPELNYENARDCLIVLDDLMGAAYRDKNVSDLFSKYSSHENVSVCLVTQNVFHQSRMSRDISVNTRVLVVFKSPRDNKQFSALAGQIRSEEAGSLRKAFLEATRVPHGYLVIDFGQKTNNLLRYRTNIFDSEYSVVYAPVDPTEDNETIEI